MGQRPPSDHCRSHGPEFTCFSCPATQQFLLKLDRKIERQESVLLYLVALVSLGALLFIWLIIVST